LHRGTEELSSTLNQQETLNYMQSTLRLSLQTVSISEKTVAVVRGFVNKNVETICIQVQIILGHLYGETEENYEVLESAQSVKVRSRCLSSLSLRFTAALTIKVYLFF